MKMQRIQNKHVISIKLASFVVVAAVLLCMLVSNALATTYYVAANGNDSNLGSSPTSPWQSCPGMPNWRGSAILKPGDLIYFNNSDSWIVSSGYHILNVTAGVTYDGSTWGTGIRAIFRATGQLGRGVITFLSDDPSTPTVVRGIEVDVNNQSTHGVVFDAGYASSNQDGAKKIVENCIIHHVGTGYYYGVYISPWNNRSISNVDIVGSVIYTTPRSAVNNYPGPQDGSQTHNVTIRGCEAYDAGNDAGSGGFGINIKGLSYNSIIEYNYSHDNHGGGITISGDSRTPLRAGPQDAIIRYNILSSNATNGVYIWEEGDKNAVFYGNLIFNNAGAGFYFDSSVVDDINFKLYNNTFFHNNGSILIPSISATFTSFEIKNNIFYPRNGYYGIKVAGSNQISAHNNNLYYRADNGTLAYIAGTGYALNGISSWEGSSRSNNPTIKSESNLPTGFVNYNPNTDGLSLQSGSPAIDAGIDLGILYATSINSVSRASGSAWDIGAYEVQAAVTAVRPSPPVNLLLVQ